MKTRLIILSLLALLAACTTKYNESAQDVDNCGVITRLDTTSKTVYLVFTAHFSANDSGYFENFDGVVPVLDTMKARGVKGSFFPTGACFSQPKYAEAFRRIIDEGHFLSHHSDKHLLLCPYGNKEENLVTEDSLRADIADVEAKLNALGLEKKDYSWMIPPYEHYNSASVEILKSMGYKIVNPTPGIETGMDWMGKSSSNYVSAETQLKTIADYEAAHSLNGCIILVHAMVYPDRTDEDRIFTHLGEIIDELKAKGYSFGTFKDLS